MIISGFPGIGKSELFRRQKELGLTVTDSDSSKFSWLSPGVRNPNFISDYLEHIMSFDEDTVVLASSHKEVRNALENHRIMHYVIYPTITSKPTYMENYIIRGSSVEFVENISANWDLFIEDIVNDPGLESDCKLSSHINICLPEGTYLYDLFKEGYCSINNGFCSGIPTDIMVKRGVSKYPYYCTICSNMLGGSFIVKNGKRDNDKIQNFCNKLYSLINGVQLTSDDMESCRKIIDVIASGDITLVPKPGKTMEDLGLL